MNYTTSLSGLICPPKSSKFLEFAHWRFPSLILPASCIIPISIFCPTPSLWAITTLELPKDVSPAFSAGNPLHPTQCRAEASLLMPPKVMNPACQPHGVMSHFNCSESRALSQRNPALSQHWPCLLPVPPLSPHSTALWCRDITRNMHGLPKNMPPTFSVNSTHSWWLELNYTTKHILTWAKWLQPSEG